MPSILNAPLSGGVTITSDTSAVLQLQTASTTALTINASQQVLVNTATSFGGGKLTVAGGIAAKSDNAWVWVDNAAGTGFPYISPNGYYVDGGYEARIYSTGVGTSLPILFATAGVERMRINAGAPILCLAGGSTTATGTGIAFPATQSASSDANTLDDYEEGTYTVTFTPQTSGSITLGVNTAAYTKIGRMVTVTGSIDVSSVSSPTGTHIKMNLPFTVANSDTTVSAGVVNFNVLGSSKAANIGWATIPKNTTTVEIYDGSVNSVGTGAFATYIVANTNCRFSLTYFTS